ncbi:hypothetical protein B0T26DRAFT_717085 [Lasiosphaeria miniovina]|uniref:Uncharacterized protein n=1 Tax=Lasiosphaeria miniovina TaxID=1954250 RepID=A0AA40ACN8_9PEZI|nr:uncharacterized protein B0T26DRAFT_717085 [Lasiosphaeria miniovina]KAK0713319.1 hypothetical protein B0T26DRAFT_717085 [Lasiosphaeria miniovina]
MVPVRKPGRPLRDCPHLPGKDCDCSSESKAAAVAAAAVAGSASAPHGSSTVINNDRTARPPTRTGLALELNISSRYDPPALAYQDQTYHYDDMAGSGPVGPDPGQLCHHDVLPITSIPFAAAAHIYLGGTIPSQPPSTLLLGIVTEPPSLEPATDSEQQQQQQFLDAAGPQDTLDGFFSPPGRRETSYYYPHTI